MDVLRSSHLTSPAHLSSETIINFAENGVHPTVFCRLMELAIHARVSALLDWEGEDGCKRLWNKVAEEGGVFSARIARLFPGIARVMGQIRDDKSEEWEDEDGLDQIDVAEHSVAWWADPISGSPSSLEETVMRLLDAGFSPSRLQVLRDKLREVAFKAIRTCVQKFHIQVPESCTAFVIPGQFILFDLPDSNSFSLFILILDPHGVLEPGQVHIKSSFRNLKMQNGETSDIVLGDVLVSAVNSFKQIHSHENIQLTRHPCKVASDVQRVCIRDLRPSQTHLFQGCGCL